MPITDANLPSSTTSTAAATSAQPFGRCPLCNAPLQKPDECSMCDWVKGYEERETARPNPRDAIAAILNIMWPGIGHFYKGYTNLGIALAAGGLMCFVWAAAFFMFFGFLIFPVYWLWVAVDGYFRKDLKFPGQSPA